MIGELLYQSAEIAFDTATGHYKNPKTGVDLGTAVPPGGSKVQWYGGAGGEVIVPYGQPGTQAQSATEAAQLKAAVTNSLLNKTSVTAVTGSTSTTVTGQQSGGSTATTGSSTPGTAATTNSQNSTFPGSVLSQIPDFPALDFAGIPWYVWALGAAAVWYFMSSGHSGGRRRNPGKTFRGIRQRISRGQREAGMPKIERPFDWARTRYREEQSFKRGRKSKAPRYPGD